MGSEINLVVTAYGHGEVIDKIAVSTFSASGSWRNDENACTYCEMLNSLDLQGNSWVFAKIVPENTPINVKLFLPLRFAHLVLALDDRALQRLLREVDSRVLAAALVGCSEAVLEKTLKNVSSRIAQDLKKDLEHIHGSQRHYIEDSQNKIMDAAWRLEEKGEIVIDHSK